MGVGARNEANTHNISCLQIEHHAGLLASFQAGYGESESLGMRLIHILVVAYKHAAICCKHKGDIVASFVLRALS